MKKLRYTGSQIMAILKQREAAPIPLTNALAANGGFPQNKWWQ